jgi:hypothetical protein
MPYLCQLFTLLNNVMEVGGLIISRTCSFNEYQPKLLDVIWPPLSSWNIGLCSSGLSCTRKVFVPLLLSPTEDIFLRCCDMKQVRTNGCPDETRWIVIAPLDVSFRVRMGGMGWTTGEGSMGEGGVTDAVEFCCLAKLSARPVLDVILCSAIIWESKELDQ